MNLIGIVVEVTHNEIKKKTREDISQWTETTLKLYKQKKETIVKI